MGVTGVGRAEGALRSPLWPHLPRWGADGGLRSAAEGEASSPPRPLSPLCCTAEGEARSPPRPLSPPWGAAEVEARLPPRPRTPLWGTAEGEALPPPRPLSPCVVIPSRGEAPLRGELRSAAAAVGTVRNWRAFRAEPLRGTSDGSRVSSSGGTSETLSIARPVPEMMSTEKDRTPLRAKISTMRPRWEARVEVVPEPTNWTIRPYMSEEKVGCAGNGGTAATAVAAYGGTELTRTGEGGSASGRSAVAAGTGSRRRLRRSGSGRGCGMGRTSEANGEAGTG